MKRLRLDQYVHQRGLTASREQARRLIMAGEVLVDGQVVDRPATPVAEGAQLALRARPRYASRGGEKLAAALERFGVDVRGRVCADVGASTGGFTDVLLGRGAATIVALDVGHGQLDWRLRNDPRVIVREGVNARYLSRDDVPPPTDLVTIDVAFISLDHIFPALGPFVQPGTDVVALVKPQFEAGRDQVGKGGLVTDPAVHEAVLARVTEAAAQAGLERIGMAPAAITGATGNQEFFLHLRKR